MGNISSINVKAACIAFSFFAKHSVAFLAAMGANVSGISDTGMQTQLPTDLIAAKD